MTALNILAPATWYPSKIDPFVGNFVKRHCEAIATSHNVWVIFVASAKTKSEERIEKSCAGNLTEIIIYQKPASNDIFGNFKKRKIVLDAVKKTGISFDLIHAHFVFPLAPMFESLSQALDIPWVFTEHWSGFHKKFRPKINSFKWIWVMKAARSAKMSFPVSENLQDAMKIEFPDQEMILVPNVVEDVFFNSSKKENSDNCARFLHVSNLVEEFKNLKGTLKALSILQEEGIEFQFQIISDGDSSKAKKWVEQLGLSDQVSFEGPSDSDQIAEAMASSDALILFSNTENQPCVVLESIAIGLPIIASWVGDLPNLVSDKRGLITAPGDVDQLAKNLKTFISRKGIYTAKEVSRGARESFSKEAVGKKYAEAYRKVLNI
ncbi:MAG: glycosyltransferase [Flavobacteriales bacterium]|nr:glycosyltransferase [Flavobacteriales bacterium]